MPDQTTPQPPESSDQWPQLLQAARRLAMVGKEDDIGDVLVEAYSLGIVVGLDRATTTQERAVGRCEAAALDELDQQIERAETAEQALRRAVVAVQAGDWSGLWTALGIPLAEQLPYMRFDAGEPLGLEQTGLTAEQEIRVEALHAAVRTMDRVDAPTVRDLEQTIIGTAERYAAWIAEGSTDAWDFMGAKSDA